MKKLGVASVRYLTASIYASLRAVAGRFKRLVVFTCCCFLFIKLVSADDSISKDGQFLAFETTRGNCLACHQIPGGTQMGDIGPPLNNIAQRFPERDILYRQIWDAGAFNSETLMPPYGRQEILSETEIHAIIDFLYTK